MRILVTGGAGFVARYIARELMSFGHDVVLSDVVSAPSVKIADLTDVAALCQLVEEIRPEACVHLGAMAFVPDGDRQAERLWRINVGGTENLCTALKTNVPEARLLFVSTAQVYGAPCEEDSRLVDESGPCDPQSAYARSKVAAERIVLSSGLNAFIARPANHTGPGQSPRFVVPSFISQALEIRAGLKNEFIVGNLESVRDFTDVRDVVSAYRLILERGVAGNVYNIGSEERLTIGELLKMIQTLAGITAPVRINPEFYRPTDFSLKLSVERMKELGWTSSYKLEDTLHDMLYSQGNNSIV